MDSAVYLKFHLSLSKIYRIRTNTEATVKITIYLLISCDYSLDPSPLDSANKREVSPLCLKLLTTVCNSRYSGMVVLGESAQSWGGILWRCRAEQWLFGLLHSSRRRHICRKREESPSFMTFSSYKFHTNLVRDLSCQHPVIFECLALLQNTFWVKDPAMLEFWNICQKQSPLKLTQTFIKSIIRIIPTTEWIWNLTFGPLVHI